MSVSPQPEPLDPLADRLDFLALDAKARARLETLSALALPHLGPALSAFYDKITSTPQVSGFFADRAHMDLAKAKQSDHWRAVARGRLDADYYESSLKIGNRHARIGLEPRWYIGGYGLVLETVIKGVVHDWMAGEAQRLRKRKPTEAIAAADDLAAGLADLVKAVMIDVDLAVSTYFDALTDRIEEGRQKAEAQARTQEEVLATTGAALGGLAKGHLDTRIAERFDGDFARLSDDFNAAARSLEHAFIEIRGSVDAIARNADSVAGSAGDLSERVNRQAAAIQQSAQALDEVTANVNDTASGTGQAAALATSANGAAQEGGTVVEGAVAAMNRIEQSSSKISTIISVIDDIAFQTNLLALNAAVEAARAGESGRGFAVVATEVRSLAQRSAQAARDVSALISSSGTEVGQGVGLVRRTGEALADIVDQVGRISGHMASFSTASAQQAASLNEINAAIVQLDTLTRENAGFVEQAGEAGRDLTREVSGLYARLSAFRTSA